MAIDADEILIILQRYIAAQVGAEGAGLIVIFAGADKEGGVVDDRAEVLHDFVMHLHPYPYLDAALGRPIFVFSGDGTHPFGADPAGARMSIRRL